MKKYIIAIIMAFVLTGCGTKNLMNTPTKKVEMFFENYQTLNEDVLEQLNNTVKQSSEFTDDQKEEYKSLMKKHYQSLKYDIKDEKIDGDQATVTVEIEVKDYSKVMTLADLYLEENQKEFEDEDGNYSKEKFMDYRLKELKKVDDTVKYTIELNLTKIDDEWKLDNLSDTDMQKINGIYNY